MEKLSDPSVPKPGSTWRHYKGDVYKVECLGMREATNDYEVCYFALKEPLDIFWIRPLSEWNETVTYEGNQINRFVPCGDQ